MSTSTPGGATRPVTPSLPFIPGHEGVAPGDRVAIPWRGHACGICDHSVSGWETLCLQQRKTGRCRRAG